MQFSSVKQIYFVYQCNSFRQQQYNSVNFKCLHNSYQQLFSPLEKPPLNHSTTLHCLYRSRKTDMYDIFAGITHQLNRISCVCRSCSTVS